MLTANLVAFSQLIYKHNITFLYILGGGHQMALATRWRQVASRVTRLGSPGNAKWFGITP